MNLRHVTLSGGDDSLMHQDMLELSKKYAIVEWGILLSDKASGVSRYPSREWIAGLGDSAGLSNLSLHICDGYVQKFCDEGVGDFPVHVFQRLQFNIAERVDLLNGVADFIESLPLDKEIILQLPDVSDLMVKKISKLFKSNRLVSISFDQSSGRGVVPASWPCPPENFSLGYSGGLNPANIRQQLKKISRVAGDHPIWIDLETGLRTGNSFDLAKALEFLEFVKVFLDKNDCHGVVERPNDCGEKC